MFEQFDAIRMSIEQEGEAYYAYSDDLPGVYGLGDTVEEAKASMLGGIRLYLLATSE